MFEKKYVPSFNKVQYICPNPVDILQVSALPYNSIHGELHFKTKLQAEF